MIREIIALFVFWLVMASAAFAGECNHMKHSGGTIISAKVYSPPPQTINLAYRCGNQVSYKDWICSVCLEEGTDRIEYYAGDCPGQLSEYDRLRIKSFESRIKADSMSEGTVWCAGPPCDKSDQCVTREELKRANDDIIVNKDSNTFGTTLIWQRYINNGLCE